MQPTKKAAEMTERELARYIDQSVLKPEFTVEVVAGMLGAAEEARGLAG